MRAWSFHDGQTSISEHRCSYALPEDKPSTHDNGKLHAQQPFSEFSSDQKQELGAKRTGSVSFILSFFSTALRDHGFWDSGCF